MKAKKKELYATDKPNKNLQKRKSSFMRAAEY